ncbi:MAG: hypothetical protein U0841_16240 [Chloroflexia bacterium]
MVRGGGRALARLRKRVIHGSAEVFDEGVIRSDYAGVGEYYRVANLRRPGICPGRYAFAVGPGVCRGRWSRTWGRRCGWGRSRRRRRMRWGGRSGGRSGVLQAGDAPCPGWGELVWTAEGVRGGSARPLATIAEDEVGRWRAGLARLGAAGFDFDAGGGAAAVGGGAGAARGACAGARAGE